MVGAGDFPAGERGFAGNGRFEVLRRIGGGGMGIVYEAIDNETHARVALKTLRSMGAESLRLFKNEFRAIADVHHPNLVSLGELLEESGQWFFTMDLVAGEHFLAYVRAPTEQETPTVATPLGEDESTMDAPGSKEPPPARGPDASTVRADGGSRGASPEPTPARGLKSGGPDHDRLRGALRQLALGLSALHDAGKVHCDVKPSNILVTAEGRVVVLDFGLITETTGPGANELRGTISYMAPEQIGGEGIGPAADWYAVGVLLYQSLTGYLPVRGSPEEIMLLKRAIEPPPPSAFQRDVPADLDRLAMELLRVDPTRRPSGREILRRLGCHDDATPTPSREGRFVGRATELATLRAAYDDARNGASVSVLLSGESGVGKSAIARRFGESVAAGEGALVFRNRCHERESVPYKAIDGIIDALSRHLAALTRDEARAILPPHADVLAQVFPVLRDVLARTRGLRIEGEDAALDPQVRRARLFAATRELLVSLAAKRPVVLAIDDLQWADADGLALLAHVLRPPGAPALLLIGTVRAALATESGPKTVQPIAKAIPGDVRLVELSSLPANDARTLARELLGTSDDDSGVAAIADEAGGHPLFIDELVRRRAAHADVTAKVSLDDALWARIDRLDAVDKRLLELLVVAGAPIAQEAAALALGAGFGDFSRHATRLRAANLARTDGIRRADLIEPYHDRLRAAVIEHLAPADKKAWHERLALALETTASADPEALAVHLRESGDRVKAARYAERAADDAASALAFDRAARLYKMAIDLAPAEGDSKLEAKLGEAYANAGRGADAADAFLTAARHEASQERALELRRRAAEQLLRSGRVDRALAAFEEVLGTVGLYAPGSAKTSLGLLLARRAQLRLRGLRFEKRDESALAPSELIRIDSCWAVGTGLGLVDFVRGAYFQTRALLLSLEAGEPRRIARSLAGEVCFSSADGGRSARRTSELHERAEALARELGDPYALAWARGSGGVAAALEGRWRAGLAACDEAESLFDRCLGTAWEIGTMRWFAQWSLAYLGRLSELSRRVPAGLREAEARADLYGELRYTTGLQTLASLAADDPTSARDRCRDALARWSQKTFHVEHWWAMLAERQLDLYEGKGCAAYRGVTGTWPRLAGSLLLMAQLTELEARHLRARSALAAAREDRARAGELLRAASADARKMRRAHMPWSDPLADLVDAAVAATCGERARRHADLERNHRPRPRRHGPLCGGRPPSAGLAARRRRRTRARLGRRALHGQRRHPTPRSLRGHARPGLRRLNDPPTDERGETPRAENGCIPLRPAR